MIGCLSVKEEWSINQSTKCTRVQTNVLLLYVCCWCRPCCMEMETTRKKTVMRFQVGTAIIYFSLSPRQHDLSSVCVFVLMHSISFMQYDTTVIYTILRKRTEKSWRHFYCIQRGERTVGNLVLDVWRWGGFGCAGRQPRRRTTFFTTVWLLGLVACSRLWWLEHLFSLKTLFNDIEHCCCCCWRHFLVIIYHQMLYYLYIYTAV